MKSKEEGLSNTRATRMRISKILILSVVLIAASSASVRAQSRIGVHLLYGSYEGRPGIGLNGEFFVARKVSIASEINSFWPDKTYLNTTQIDFWTGSICADVHYYFVAKEKIGFYGLAGSNLSVFRISFRTANPVTKSSNSNADVGLNVGAGMNVKVNEKIIPFAQTKYETNQERVLWQVGIRVSLK